MAETDKSSKTEMPTRKRLDEEFIKGNFPQAQEVGVAFVLIAGLMVMLFAGKGLTFDVLNLSVSLFGNLSHYDINPDSIGYWSGRGIATMGRLAGPFLVAGMIAAIAAGGLQSRFRLTPKVLELKTSKLNPVNGFKRLASKDTLIKFGIDLLKLLAVGLIMYGAIRKIIKDPIFYTSIDFMHIGEFIADTISYVLIRLILAMSIIAVISYFYQRHKNIQDLKMTKEEVKREKKDSDISPELRKARMQMAMRLMQKQMLGEVATADVVVVNPTHYAVALKYERGVDDAPMVLAKGENAFAKRIKEMAKRHDVPLVENKMIARMLYKFGKVGDSIPMELYQSVAEILAFVYRTHKYYFHKLEGRRTAKRNF